MKGLSFDKRLANQPALEAKRLLAERLFAAWSWKSNLAPSFPPIVCLMGGTGTGKSTLFNSLAGHIISDVGKTRPFTVRPRILAPEEAVESLRSCPFLQTSQDTDETERETPDLVVSLQDTAFEGLILVDTPDFDSVELNHHITADSFFILSDVIVFVTSQEKYGDMIGYRMIRRAMAWGKALLFVMNKVSSEGAYDDFRNTLREIGCHVEPIRVERIDGAPRMIPGLQQRPEFAYDLFHHRSITDPTRVRELKQLRAGTASALKDLERSVQGEHVRIGSVNDRIVSIHTRVCAEMEERLDTVVSGQVEEQIRHRLQQLLRKYDILFVPRMIIRSTLKKALFTVGQWIGVGFDGSEADDYEKSVRSEDLRETRAAARLEPLETAIAKLNREVAGLLSSDSGLDDLRRIALYDVPRFDSEDIRRSYEDAFPGVEHLLEGEFEHLRSGLSASDEVKLYGSYTLWALLLVTVEVTVLGGSALLDAVLSAVIVPLIPKWILNLKVVEMLKDIAHRVEREHRRTLTNILQEQADRYIREFSSLLPDGSAILQLNENIRDLDASD
jgi:energy-coupling factor transporter ATP-binding protein EcfA2